MNNNRASAPTDLSSPSSVDSYQAMVLLVDDQMFICEAVRRALADDPSIDFHYCTNPAEALSVCRELKPTVILQDLVMPGVDGLDLVRQYRADAALGAVPVIVLSARDEPETKSAAFAAGANDYLVKLPDCVELIARIRYHTRAYVDHLQRDAAYAALRESQRQLMIANMELERLTRVDWLTGLGNRRNFDEYITAEWRRASRSKTPLALLMADVDHFKRYNDTYGHLAGDEVLRKMGTVLQGCARRAGDLAARFGGEEFAVVLIGSGLEDAKKAALRLAQSVRDLEIEHGTGHVSVSVGVAVAQPGRDDGPQGLIHAADQALFQAKAEGRDRVAWADGGASE